MFVRDQTYEQTFAGSYIGDFPGGFTYPVSSALGTTWLDGTGIVLGTATGSMIGTDPAQKLGLWGATPVVRPTALTTKLTHITHTAPGTPDYAIQNLVAGGFGFVTADEGNTLLKVVLNLQVRLNELETKLQAIGALS